MGNAHSGRGGWLPGFVFMLVLSAVMSYDLILASPATAAPEAVDGAAAYAMHCNRCHVERYPRERTDEQWETIMFHMRTRAQIPYDDAEAILEYLKQSN